MDKLEPLNYTDVDYLIEALTHYIGTKEGRVGTYRVELLLKLQRNKRVIYDENLKSTSGEREANG